MVTYLPMRQMRTEDGEPIYLPALGKGRWTFQPPPRPGSHKTMEMQSRSD